MRIKRNVDYMSSQIRADDIIEAYWKHDPARKIEDEAEEQVKKWCDFFDRNSIPHIEAESNPTVIEIYAFMPSRVLEVVVAYVR
jgi:hypothetical protein